MHTQVRKWMRNLRTKIRKCVPTEKKKQRSRETNNALQKYLYHQVDNNSTKWNVLFANDARFPFMILAYLVVSDVLRLGPLFIASMILRTSRFIMRNVHAEICLNATPVLETTRRRGQYLLTWTQPSSILKSTWERCFIVDTSAGVESAHWPFLIGFANEFVNSFLVPRRFGFTKLTMQWSAGRCAWLIKYFARYSPTREMSVTRRPTAGYCLSLGTIN